MPETKEQIRHFAGMVKDEVMAGYIDPLQFYIRMKAMELLQKEIMDDPDIRAAVMKEADHYNAKTFDAFGAKITVKEVGVRYDFTQCGSADWEQRNRWANEHAEARKKIEDFLKKVPDTGMADPETGEIVYPPARKSTTSVTVELK